MLRNRLVSHKVVKALVPVVGYKTSGMFFFDATVSTHYSFFLATTHSTPKLSHLRASTIFQSDSIREPPGRFL